jgi:hypothetical protein
VVRREDTRPPEIVRAGELDPGTTQRPDIILPPAVADSSTATLSATVGQSGHDVQQELYTDEGRARAAREAATVGGHPDADLPGPAQARWHNAGRVPPGGRRPRSGSAPRAAASARPRSPLGRSRRSRATSCHGPGTWCRCRAAAT